MSYLNWQKTHTGIGRDYLFGKDIQANFEDSEEIFNNLVTEVIDTIQVQAVVRFLLDGVSSQPEQSFIPTPFVVDNLKITENLSSLLLQTVMNYYISANHNSSHFGITNTILEKKQNSFIKREIETLLKKIQERPDLSGRILKDVRIAPIHEFHIQHPFRFKEIIQKNLNIHIGCQIQINGNAINHNRIFLPFQTNSGILNCLYYNLEHIITQNLVSFSESSDQYLKITDRTILRELESTISRLKVKVNTRKKLLKDLVHQDQFNFIGNDSGFPQVNLKIAKDLYSATIAGFPQESFASDVITANIPTFGIHSKKEDQNISDADSIPENDSKVDYPEIEKSSEEIQFDKKKVEAINFHPNEDDFERRKQSKRNYVPHPFKENLKANSFKRRKSDWQEKLPNRISKTVDMD
ncbi:MAG: hypothetical protein HOD92_02495 [Deltaproteobacteria bacterium]|jgi:hypothetical protein|nr:hypothetical protein [Deltaproteobacteria bacterium]MBT4527339.1 hypothetical protein [Deltaproteobacteria bacterium]